MEVLRADLSPASRDFRFPFRSARTDERLSRTLSRTSKERKYYILREDTRSFFIIFKSYGPILKLFLEYILKYPFYILSSNYEATWIILTRGTADLHAVDIFPNIGKPVNCDSQYRGMLYGELLSNNRDIFRRSVYRSGP